MKKVWTYIFGNRHTESKLMNFIRNVYVFRNSLSNHVSWDYTGSLLALKDGLSDVEKTLDNHSYGDRGKKQAKDIRTVINLIDRIIEDSYTTDKFKYEFIHKTEDGLRYLTTQQTRIFDLPITKEFSYRQRKHDMELLCKILQRKLLTWWD